MLSKIKLMVHAIKCQIKGSCYHNQINGLCCHNQINGSFYHNQINGSCQISN